MYFGVRTRWSRAEFNSLWRSPVAESNDLTLATPRTERLEVESNLQDLNRILQWFEVFNGPHVPREVWLQCQSALAEGFTNAVRHAHRSQPPETPIVLLGELGRDYLKLSIFDRGTWFDLQAAIARLPLEVDCSSGGGRGLQILERVADVLSYERQGDGHNRLLLIRYFQPLAHPDPAEAS